MNKRYGNAQNIVEQGRIESQRMLMERYNRVNNEPINQNQQQQPSVMRNSNDNSQNYYARYYNHNNYAVH